MNDFHYIYTLESRLKPGQLYTGYTQDLKKRLAYHNSRNVMYTAAHAPWFIRSATAFRDKEKALEFERYLKSGSGRAFLKRHL